MIRDLLTGEVPHVLRPGGFYATASATGAIAYVGLVSWLNIVKPWAMVAVVLLVVALRLLSEWLGWSSPTPYDLTPTVASVPRRTYRVLSRAMRPRHRTGSLAEDSVAAVQEITELPAEEPAPAEEPPANGERTP